MNNFECAFNFLDRGLNITNKFVSRTIRQKDFSRIVLDCFNVEHHHSRDLSKNAVETPRIRKVPSLCQDKLRAMAQNPETSAPVHDTEHLSPLH